MITHPPWCQPPDFRKVLVIGAGDGAPSGTGRYPQIARLTLVEIERWWCRSAGSFCPRPPAAWTTPVSLFFEDGLKFVRRKENEYDLIIVDSTDPFGPGEVLFTKEFYGNCYQALTEKGILINQHESPFYEVDAEKCARPTNGSAGFPHLQGVSGSHAHLSFGSLALWLCQQGPGPSLEDQAGQLGASAHSHPLL